jgi:hypothetical protein
MWETYNGEEAWYTPHFDCFALLKAREKIVQWVGWSPNYRLPVRKGFAFSLHNPIASSTVQGNS